MKACAGFLKPMINNAKKMGDKQVYINEDMEPYNTKYPMMDNPTGSNIIVIALGDICNVLIVILFYGCFFRGQS